ARARPVVDPQAHATLRVEQPDPPAWQGDEEIAARRVPDRIEGASPQDEALSLTARRQIEPVPIRRERELPARAEGERAAVVPVHASCAPDDPVVDAQLEPAADEAHLELGAVPPAGPPAM